MYAVIVDNVYKKFGKSEVQYWHRLVDLIKPVKKNGTANIVDGDEQGSKNVQTETRIGQEVTKDEKQRDNGKSVKKNIVAVDHVSFQVKFGEIFGVLGPNGGGKSTLIRLISTLLLPDEGKIFVHGINVEKHPMQVQRLINRVSVEASFFKKLSPMENLMYGVRLYGIEIKDVRKQIVDILLRLGLEKRAINHPMEEMSRGMQQKVAIARALLTKPSVLLLDEPTTGLDPRSKREVQKVIRELRDQYGVTIILTTHDMLEADSMCDRIAIMDRGKVVALDKPERLKEMILPDNGHAVSLEEVFLKLTGKQLVEANGETG